MTIHRIRALFHKEWIKFRPVSWLLLLFVCYATLDAFLVLKAIYTNHGSFGLFDVLVDKMPDFYKTFLGLPVLGALLGAWQVWPEAQGKRIRLLFHTPVVTEAAIGVTLCFGGLIMTASAVGYHLILAGIMTGFNLPADIILPVLKTTAVWGILSLAAFFASAAFFAVTAWTGRVIVLVCAWAAASLMWTSRDYGLKAHDLWLYTIFAAAFIPLAFFSFLRFTKGGGKPRIFALFKGLSLLLAALSLSHVLPGLYWRSTAVETVDRTMYYSPVKGQFVVRRHYPETGLGPGVKLKQTYTLENGTQLKDMALYEALPVLYSRALIKQGRFPQQVNGIPLSPNTIDYNWQFDRYKPRNWNGPEPMLYKLLENNPATGKLKNPDDFFRVSPQGDGLEFIIPRTGEVNVEKSRLFTEALMDAGFVFPVRGMAGNPNVRKPYDEGYLLIDAENGLYQMKMVNGEPVCINADQTVDGRLRGIFVDERLRREILGIVVTDNRVLAVMQRDLSLEEIPVKGFSADNTKFALWADPLGKYLTSADASGRNPEIHGRAMDRDFMVIRDFSLAGEKRDIKARDLRQTIASCLFPMHLTAWDPLTPFSRLRLEPARNKKAALMSGAFCLLVCLGVTRAKKIRPGVWNLIAAAFFGPVGLAAIFILEFKGLPRLPRPGGAPVEAAVQS